MLAPLYTTVASAGASNADVENCRRDQDACAKDGIEAVRARVDAARSELADHTPLRPVAQFVFARPGAGGDASYAWDVTKVEVSLTTQGKPEWKVGTKVRRCRLNTSG